MRTEAVGGEVQRLLRQVPFRPFVLTLENGQRVAIEHPEDIAFGPGTDGSQAGSPDFYVISGRLRLSSTFEAVTGVALADTGEAD
jgi:hypothetical protein